MNSFTWRNGTIFADSKELSLRIETKGSLDVITWKFPSPIKHAVAMDQNVILAMLEDCTIWQCGSVKQAQLASTAAATYAMFNWVIEEIGKLGPVTYGGLVDELRRLFNQKFANIFAEEKTDGS